MSIRIPRYKNTFLNQDGRVLGTKQNYHIPDDGSWELEQALINYFSEEIASEKRSITVLDFSSQFVNFRDPLIAHFSQSPKDRTWMRRPVRFELAFKPAMFDFKYFIQEFEVKREEDLSFIAKVLEASSAANPNLVSGEERQLAQTNKKIAPAMIGHFCNEYDLRYGEYKEVNEYTVVRNRRLSSIAIKSPLDNNYNIFIGGHAYNYVNLKELSAEERYQVLYLSLYRLYDLAINRKVQLNSTIVINGFGKLQDVNTFKTFYVSKEEAYERQYRIEELIVALMERSEQIGVNFVFNDGGSLKSESHRDNPFGRMREGQQFEIISMPKVLAFPEVGSN